MDFSKLIPEKDIKDVRTSSDIIKIIIDKKYLLISSTSKFVFENINLFINIFLGLLNERIWLKENLVNEYILINLKPELVEKKEPPIMTNKRKIKYKLLYSLSSEIPIFEILLNIKKIRLIKSLL
tara:strand:+ start:193 stop:567 length:375 start_codon:yes stop_codon:yes gene_type:complete